jgi:copper chaperone CopZ
MISRTLVPLRGVCPSIPGTAKGIVLSQPGVIDAQVEYETRSITVTFDPVVTTIEKIAHAIGAEIGVALVPKD